MLLCLSSNDKKSLNRLLQIKELNIASSNALFEFSFSKYKPEEILTFLDLDLSNEEDSFFFEKYFKNNFKELDKNKYENNPFSLLFKNTEIKAGPYQLGHMKVKAFQTLPYDDIEVKEDEEYLEISKIGYFKEDFRYFAIRKNDVVWMSTDPNEIETMEPYIEKVHGSLLIFGLGLGYFPYMSYLKGNIKDITIIENDKNVIDIFNKYIKNKLDIKIPFKIIQDDAYHYIKTNKLDRFDSIFVDIWHSPEDGLPLYLKFKSLLKGYKKDAYYWLNKSLLAMFRRCILTLFEENLLGYNDKNYQTRENEYDDIINKLYFYMKDMTFHSYQDIIFYLSDENLEKVINNCF